MTDRPGPEQEWQAERRRNVKYALIAFTVVVIYDMIDIVLVGGPTLAAYARLTLSLAATGFLASIVTNGGHSGVVLRVLSIMLLILSITLRVIGTWMA